MIYPTDEELAAYLEAQELPALPNPSVLIAAVIEEFEFRTGYQPFLNVDTDTVAREYCLSEPTDCIDLEGSFISITAVETKLSWQDSYRELVENQDFKKLPLRGLRNGAGYDELQLLGCVLSSDVIIRVTGVPGYCTTIPAVVYEGLLNVMCARAIQKTQTGVGFTARETQGPVTYEYHTSQAQGSENLPTKITSWESEFDKICQRFRRVGCHLE